MNICKVLIFYSVLLHENSPTVRFKPNPRIQGNVAEGMEGGRMTVAAATATG